MNRRITYASQLASSTFALQDQNEQMFDLHTLIMAILGTTTELSGLECTPTVSPSLVVNVAPGAIFAQEVIDATDYGTAPSIIPADSREIMKFAYTLDPTPFTFVAPVTPGQSRNDLIQVAFQEVDGTSTGLSFFGGVNDVTVSTPTGTTLIPVANNSITNTVNVERLDNIIIVVKAGTPAPTGTQVTPTPDAGYTGAWVITTTQGVSTITTNDIAPYPGAPFITEKLKDKASIPSVQENAYNYGGVSTGSANTYAVNLSPALEDYETPMFLFFIPNINNTGASTINVNGLGPINIVNSDLLPLTADQLDTNALALLVYGGSAFTLINPKVVHDGLPAGTRIESYATSAPTNYLAIDGSSQLVASYPDLFAVIGYAYGGSGANFSLPPNPAGKFTVCTGGGYTLTQTGGIATNNLVAAQNGAHTHTISDMIHGLITSSASDNDVYYFSAGTTETDSSGTGADIENRPPFYAINMYIKANNL